MRILENILDRCKASNKAAGQSKVDEDRIQMMGFTNTNSDAYVYDVFKNMWAENGDMISKQYAGTSSTITSVTKTGKQGFMGKID